jgi:hypothetical protein
MQDLWQTVAMGQAIHLKVLIFHFQLSRHKCFLFIYLTYLSADTFDAVT